MKTIWKYPLEITDEQVVQIPRGHRILTVQVQGKSPCLWVEVFSDAKPEPVTIYIAGTGYQCPMGRYIGTFQVEKGLIIFHVYERQ